ncbi:MAG: CvpA family protein [bacterium]
MLFTLIDVILIGLLIAFIVVGFMIGLVSGIGALFGVLAGAYVAGHYYLVVANWLTPVIFGNTAIAKIVAFIAIFVIINGLIGLIFWFVDRAYKLISIVPFLKSINHFGGMILGFCEGVLVLGLSVYVIVKLGADISWLMKMFNDSVVAHYLLFATQFLNSFLP